ncbi:PucR family transcriptional regulator [Streptomyces sp. NPDC090493]|uniref:PucR family transcriptional regulator n=1 Tax=Streptomyces sp. NPDC090493 TaxID=3365964 RepID=UPI00380E7416
MTVRASVRCEEWQPVVELCAAVTADLPVLVQGIVDVIRREVPEYAMVPRKGHEAGVTEQYQGLLVGLADRRRPSREEYERARALGRRRASEGLPAQAMISAYHVGYREMWNVLLSRADGVGERLRADLVRVVGTVWIWVQESSSASAEAYQGAVRAEDAAERALMHRFLDALYAPSSGRGELNDLARALSFEPGGEFLALCSPAREWTDDRLRALRQRLGRGPGTLRCVNRGCSMTVLTQSASGEDVHSALVALRPHAPVGIGLRRAGLDGAAASLADAGEALALAVETGRTVWFERDWMPALLGLHGVRLAPVLRSGRDVAERHPDLAEAVRRFAESGFSLTTAGKRLHLHANTVKYRLDRWQQLTGWDVRTWEGLCNSKMALELPLTGGES